jgi:hypothetical protein
MVEGGLDRCGAALGWRHAAGRGAWARQRAPQATSAGDRDDIRR